MEQAPAVLVEPPQPNEISHAKYALKIGVPPEMLEYLLRHEVFPSLRKTGRFYIIDADTAPDATTIVTRIKVLYQQHLREALDAASRLETEVESIRLDITDALENGIEPVGQLGDDLAHSVGTYRGESALEQARQDLSDAAVSVRLLHRILFPYDEAERLMQFVRPTRPTRAS